MLFRSPLTPFLVVLVPQLRASGKVLFDLVCSHLNLIEGDYFGLEFHDHRKMNVSSSTRSLFFFTARCLSPGSDEGSNVFLFLFPKVWLDLLKPIMKQLRRK